jgi:phosphohistidine phosphatase
MTARSLVLLRHAKADNPPSTADLDRPLTARGHADAQAAGAWLAGRQLPDLVICSPSKRTRQTWHGVAANLRGGAAPRVRYERRVYQGTAADLLDVVREVEDSFGVVLLVGHNPSLSQFAFDLDPEGGLDSDGLRTCGLTVHELAGPWADCGPSGAPVIASHIARAD